MGNLKNLFEVAMLMIATGTLSAAPTKEPPPTWSWPGPTPPEIREALLKKTFVFRPTERELRKIEDLTPKKPHVAPPQPRKLLVWGRLWSYMTNPLTEATVRILGKKTRAFEVVVTDDPQALLPEKLKDIDAIFLLHSLHRRFFLPPWDLKSMTQEQQDSAQELDRRIKQSILRFIREDGKGIAAIEGALNAFKDWTDFGELMGATMNGEYVGDFVIRVEEPGHALAACLGGQPFRVFDQAYVPGPPYSRKNVRVLLTLDLAQTTDPTTSEKMAWLRPSVKKLEQLTGRREYPLSWIKPYGKGRVFYLSLGVQKAPYSNALFLRYLLAGIQFVLGDLRGDMTPSEK